MTEARQRIEVEYAVKSEKLNIIHQLLRAHALFEKDVDYVVQDGRVLIVGGMGDAARLLASAELFELVAGT